MSNYLAFVCGKIEELGTDTTTDGVLMASQCINQLKSIDNPEQFPPRLLIVFTSAAYDGNESNKSLLDGIQNTFNRAGYGDIPLIGCSVSAVFFDRKVFDKGAVMICLASRLMVAVPAVCTNVRQNHEEAAKCLLDKLELNFTESGKDPNPLVNRMMIGFFPGFGPPELGDRFPAPKLHNKLRDMTRARVPIIGGVSSIGSKTDSGWQFAGRNVYKDAIVATKISSGFPFSSCIGHGLKPTGKIFRVKTVDEDKLTIRTFEEGIPAELINLSGNNDFALFGEFSLEGDPIITVARNSDDGSSMSMLREVESGTCLEYMQADPASMLAENEYLISRALQRMKVNHPVGSIGIQCNARRGVLDIRQVLEKTELQLKDAGYCVGGFFDGEIGQDQNGLSLFGNWCSANLFFGDEMRLRTPVQRGFKALTRFAPNLAKDISLDQAIKYSLKLIYDAGFPGAMLSLVLEDQGKKWVVARDAVGTRFERIVNLTRRSFDDQDILPLVAQEQQSLFIRDSTNDSRCNQEAVGLSGIVSQYVIPIKDARNESVALLQIDLGDCRHLVESEDTPPYQDTLDLLGSVIESSLMRILNREEIRIARKLDDALRKSLADRKLNKALNRFISEAVGAFGSNWGHIRLANKKEKMLILNAGIGDYYKVFKNDKRRAVKINDKSPTSQAYRMGGKDSTQTPWIVNDTLHNGWHLDFINEYKDNQRAYDCLNRIKSYANVAISYDDGTVLGALSLQSFNQWFFTPPMVRSLGALGQRIAFLHQHLKLSDKQRSDFSNLEFLYRSGSQSPSCSAKSTRDTLVDITRRFSNASNSDIASLYIWDNEIKKFVLRAQHGWHDERWVDKARYALNERWTGTVATKLIPEYIPDLAAYKKKMNITWEVNYGFPMFGTDLAQEPTLEAIGLPFEIYDGSRAVLTLYRKYASDSPIPDQRGNYSGFKTTDIKTLKTAAHNLAADVNAVMRQKRSDWVIDERERHARVCEALENVSYNRLEDVLCQQLSKTYLAREVNYYGFDDSTAPGELYWIAGSRKESESILSNLRFPDDEIIDAARSKAIVEIRHASSAHDWNKLESVEVDNVIKRVCLPLLDPDNNNLLIGVLDIRWGIRNRRVSQFERPHDKDFLIELGKKLALSYLKQKRLARQRELEESSRRSRLAVEVMSAMVLQSAHRWLNLMEDIRSLPDNIREAPNNVQRELEIERLTSMIGTAPQQVKHPLDVARRINSIKLRQQELRSIILRALQESRIIQKKPGINIELDIPKNRFVYLDKDLAREAFHNIINNSCKALSENGNLKISINSDQNDRRMDIIFEDNGIGMTNEQIETIKTGFVNSPSGTGSGVLISKLLTEAQNGKFTIQSQPGIGTRVVFTFSCEQMEVDDESIPHLGNRRQ